jgi:divalent metal cation (Fe/Co/Zn/Cd) transporter
VAEHSGSLRVIIAAIVGNVAIAICKFGAALVTGSAAMYSEAIHSTVDTGNELLLLFGMRRAGKPRDAEHPFGYGLQLYFWVFGAGRAQPRFRRQTQRRRCRGG